MPPLLILVALLVGASASAAPIPTLPYSTRTRGYSAYGTWARGDIRGIGMSNATVGLGDSWTSVSENPAGLAMTLTTFSLQLNRNQIPNGDVQSYDQPVEVSNVGAVINPYPWAFSVGYDSPNSERQVSYLSGTATEATTELSIREFQLSASRVFLDHRLSFGMQAAFSNSDRILTVGGQSYSATRMALKLTTGALWQFNRRIFFGVRYTPAATYAPPDDVRPSPALPGYLTQKTYSPWVLGLGLGWIPNVHFRGGVSMLFVGQTPDAALVSDQSRSIGRRLTVQPRIGLDYRWIDLSWLEGRFGLGSYYEMSRIDGADSRLHGTLSVEINPSLFNVGLAVDRARSYSNVIASIGVDMVRAARALEIIPPDRARRHVGFFTAPGRYDDDGLPKPINPSWDPSQTTTPGKIVDILEEIPGKIEQKLLPGSGDSSQTPSAATPPTSKPSTKPAKRKPAQPSRKAQPAR